MEALIIIVAELLLLPLIAGIAALCELLLGLLSLVLHLFFGVTLRRHKESKKNKIKIPPALIKWIQRIAIGSLVLFAAALLLINFVFLESVIRFATDKVEAKTGFDIEYDSVDGNIFTGGFELRGLDLEQTLADKPQLSVQAEDISANLSVWGFVFGKRVIDVAAVSNAKIELRTLPKAKEEKSSFDFAIAWGDKGLDAINISKSPLLKSPLVVIKDLELSDVSIHVEDRSAEAPTSYDIQIAKLQSEPIRSHFAIFDLLFRSNLDGTLNGSRLEIINTEINGEHHTRWATREVPAATLASLVGGPFHLFEAGNVDVEVSDLRGTDSVENLDLNWTIKVADAKARLPEGTPKLLQPLAQVWVDNINQSEDDWEFSFQLQFSEDQFYGASSLNAQQIWRDSIPVFIKQVAEKTGIEESAVKDKTSKALDAVKGFFEKRKEKE